MTVPLGVEAVIFDLDGVLVDTVELHFHGWKALAAELGVPFDRAVNDRLRGLRREPSLEVVLGARAVQFGDHERCELIERKNADFLARLEEMTPADLAPGARELLGFLSQRGVRAALASSSRNAHAVIERLGIAAAFGAMVDGVAAPRSKPDPQVFLLAASRLAVSPAACLVIEDGEAGIAAARAAGMRVFGIGPAERVGGADRVFERLGDIRAEDLAPLLRA